MKTRVQKWGNSVALRIPKAFAAEAHLEQGSQVELFLVEGKLVVEAVGEETLGELLEGVEEGNLHREWDTGAAAGNEVW